MIKQNSNLDSPATQAVASEVQPAPRATRPPVGGILLALHCADWPNDTLLRAAAFSRALGLKLHVMRVLPDAASVYLFARPLQIADAERLADETAESARATRAWVSEVLGDHAHDAWVEVQRGALIERVATHAARLGAAMIVVAPHGGRFGSMVEVLARISGLPVLVARAARRASAIVAATDLADPAYPVVRAAADLAVKLKAAVVALHNMSPGQVSSHQGEEQVWASRIALRADLQLELNAERQVQLARLTDVLPVEADGVISHGASALEAILEEAKRQDADLVFVGTRPQAWYQRLNGGGLAAKVVRHAKRSVMVTPLASTKVSSQARHAPS